MSITTSSMEDIESISSSLSLTDDELGKVAELRERLGPELLKATPMYNDDHSCVFWILKKIVFQ